jgi:hypothetical protein
MIRALLSLAFVYIVLTGCWFAFKDLCDTNEQRIRLVKSIGFSAVFITLSVAVLSLIVILF